MFPDVRVLSSQMLSWGCQSQPPPTPQLPYLVSTMDSTVPSSCWLLSPASISWQGLVPP